MKHRNRRILDLTLAAHHHNNGSIVGPIAEEYKTWNDIYDAYDGEVHGTISAHEKDKWTGDPRENMIGLLSYGQHKASKTVRVKMIETHPKHRRKGVATEMINKLKSEFPDHEIDWGMTTKDGSKLLKTINIIN